jgi:protein-L-isoaspartate O-methyltransferase
MITEKIEGKDINFSQVTRHIPEVMNALYDKEAFSIVTLEEIRDAFRTKQMQSKAWMMGRIKELNLDSKSKVLVVGSWLGFTSYCLFKLGFSNITETDPDSRLEKLARHLNRKNPNFVHLSEDVNSIDLNGYDLIINTSCEHIADNSWYDRIPAGTKIVLHSNNLEGYDHVNTCESVEVMSSKYPMELNFAGELNLGSYSRFMLVGNRRT